VRSCSIITCEPKELIEPIHDRMPVILPQEMEAYWLDGSVSEPGDLERLLVPYPADLMYAYQVSQIANSVKNDSPELLERVV
jgi:putative SOS response-associated peptidase YedK